MKAAVVWNAGAPPKRGAYRVKSEGPSANTGYRYWNGERWSPLASTRKAAITWGKPGNHRKTPTRYAILWASKASAKTMCVACGQPLPTAQPTNPKE